MAATLTRTMPRVRTEARVDAREAPTARRTRRSEIVIAGKKDARRLMVLAIGFMGLGLIMVLSASSVVSITQYGSPWSLFERQVMWTVLASIGFLFFSRVDLARLRRFAVPAVFGSGFLLMLVLVHGVGTVAGGSSRWIGIGPITLQPSEFAKLAFVVFAADLVARRAGAKDEFQSIVRPLVVVLAAFGILILRQPDMGTAMILMCITLTVLYAGGVQGKLLGISCGVVAFGGLFLALYAPYRRARLLSFLDPFAHASTSGYQIVQSLVALGSGHITGTGIGSSAAAWGLLPNAQTDFIFAIIGNELGLIGACFVLVAFGIFGWLGIRIAARSEDLFSCLLAAGLTCWIVSQALINIGGVLGVLPDTGIPLPFLSFGGSSLIVVLAATGLLINIARNPKARPARANARAARGARAR